MHKVGFITASKCKDVCSRQTTLEKKNDFSVTALAKNIVTEQVIKVKTVANDPQNLRDWGLKHEDSARNACLHVQKHLHYKVKLTEKGFLISKANHSWVLVKTIFEAVSVHVNAKMWLLNTSALGFIAILIQRKHL